MALLTVENNEQSPKWKATDGNPGTWAIVETSNDFIIYNDKSGKSIFLKCRSSTGPSADLQLREDPAQSQRAQLDLALNPQGSKITLGGEVELHGKGSSGGETKMILKGKIKESTVIGARVYNNADISIPSATLTVLPLNSEAFDTDAIHDNVTNNSRLTAKTSGVYLITGNVKWNPNASNNRELIIRLNGTAYLATSWDAANAGGLAQVVTTVYSLTVNAYVELCVFQDSATSQTVKAYGVHSPYFSMVRMP